MQASTALFTPFLLREPLNKSKPIIAAEGRGKVWSFRAQRSNPFFFKPLGMGKAHAA
jgi:hypothetical protein